MGRLTEKEVIEGFKIDNALLGENESGTVERNNIAIICIEELQEYRSICDSPEKLKLIDALYLERCEEINKLKAELTEIRNKTIEEFAEKFIYKAVCEGCSGCCNCYEKGGQSECEDWNALMKIAEKLKEVQDVN